MSAEFSKSDAAELSDTLGFLECRVREETDAAADAASVEATLAHVLLATAYAKRFNECSGSSTALAAESWVAEHRLW